MNFGVSYRESLQSLIIIVVKNHTSNAVVSSEDDSVSARLVLYCRHMTSFTFLFLNLRQSNDVHWYLSKI